jgi:hypothetical protein
MVGVKEMKGAKRGGVVRCIDSYLAAGASAGLT